MGKGNVAQPFDWEEARHGFPHERKHLAKPGMEQQRFIVRDEVLVEREPASTRENDGCIDAINPVGNFMHVRARSAIRNSHGSLLATRG
jgi:hypothetical protein